MRKFSEGATVPAIVMHIVSFLKFTGKVVLAFAFAMLVLKLATKVGAPDLRGYVSDPAGQLGLA